MIEGDVVLDTVHDGLDLHPVETSALGVKGHAKRLDLHDAAFLVESDLGLEVDVVSEGVIKDVHGGEVVIVGHAPSHVGDRQPAAAGLLGQGRHGGLQAQADNLRLAGDTGLRMAQKAAKRGVITAVVKGGLMGASSGGFTGNSTQSLVSAPGYGPVVPT